MKNSSTALLLFSALFLLVLQVSALGSGTSTINLSVSSASIGPGGSATLNYSVKLASGSTWGTTLTLVNQSQLTSLGISVSMSTPEGNPPFSGSMTITASPATPLGSYPIFFRAVGDDPSANDTAFILLVSAGLTTSAPTTTTQNNYNYSSNLTSPLTQYYTPDSSIGIIASVLLVIITLSMTYSLLVWDSLLTRLVIIGTALILVGAVVWLYGDYSGGLLAYVFGGVAAVIAGTAVWLYGDLNSGIFKRELLRKLVSASILLMFIGTVVWLYGDYNGGVPLFIWGGTALLLLGTIVWLYADLRAGAFLRRRR